MKYELEQLKALVEAGDTATLDAYLYKAVEKEDVPLLAKVNSAVRSELDSEKDRHAAKHLDTWKANNLDALIEEEVNKRNPQKTPEQLEIEKLRAEIEAERKERAREALKTTALEALTKEGLPTDLIERLVGDDADTTTQHIESFKTIVEQVKQSAINGVYKDNGYTPPQQQQQQTTTTSLSEIANAANIRN